MSERATLPHWLVIAASSAAALIAAFTVSGAVASALSAQPSGFAAVSADAREFSTSEPNLTLLTTDEASTALAIDVELVDSDVDGYGADETEIGPAGCGILFYGVEIRSTDVLARSAASSVEVPEGSVYLGQTASYFDDAQSASAALADVAAALTACDGQPVGQRDGNWSAVYLDATTDVGIAPNEGSIVVSYSRNLEHSWHLLTLAGNVVVTTSVFFSAADEGAGWDDTRHGVDWFSAALDKLARQPQNS